MLLVFPNFIMAAIPHVKCDAGSGAENECLANLVLFGSPKYTEINDSHIINATIKYLLDSERFNGPLL